MNTHHKVVPHIASVCVLMLLQSEPSGAKGLTEPEVAAAVQTWVRHITADARPDAVVERMEAFKVNGETTAYIAHLADRGFCLCGADDLTLPVYLYSPQGTYNPANTDLISVCEEISGRHLSVRSLAKQAGGTLASLPALLAERPAYWADLIAGRVPEESHAAKGKGEPESLELALTSQWSQGSPYNDLCPTLVPGQDATCCAAGCVPIAAAQILNFWKWPATGVGTHSGGWYPRSYSSSWLEEPLASDPGVPGNWAEGLGQGRILEWTSSGGGKLRMRGYWDVSVLDHARGLSASVAYQDALTALFNRMADVRDPLAADFGSATWRWDLMRDHHTDADGLDAGDAAVATLCYHLGVAIGVRYGVWGTSGGWMIEALTSHFRYDPDALVGSSNPDSIPTITEELQWSRPVSLDGCGHRWVAYGYNKRTDPNREFLMNMGGGPGDSHVWYTYDAGSTNVWCAAPRYEYRIAPANVVRFVGATSAGDGSPSAPHRDIDEALASAPNGASLVFKAGSVNSFSAPALTISRPLVLKGVNATIRKL